jgi:hypothetical protein
MNGYCSHEQCLMTWPDSQDGKRVCHYIGSSVAAEIHIIDYKKLSWPNKNLHSQVIIVELKEKN